VTVGRTKTALGAFYRRLAARIGVRPSMGSVGDAHDNAMAESFFASLECELIDRRNWQTKTEARGGIACSNTSRRSTSRASTPSLHQCAANTSCPPSAPA
jgi:transposase InsO family protein